MKKYIGSFKDINDNLYTVNISTSASNGEDEEITLGGNPVIINTVSDGIFDCIKSREAVIEFVTKRYHFDLYSPKSREVKVEIFDSENNRIFFGYLTPNSYDQEYTYLDTVQLNAVDAISTLKDYRWKSLWCDREEYIRAFNEALEILGIVDTVPESGWSDKYIQVQQKAYDILKGYALPGEIIEVKDYITILNLIILLLQDCGYSGNLYVHNAYDKINNKTLQQLNINTILEGLYVAPSNFYDDDASRTPWTLYDVLYEILRFLNMSLIPYGDDVYLINYRYLDKENSSSSFTVYSNILDSTHTATVIPLYTNINLKNIKSSGTPSISLDDIYNKIDVNDNLYTLDKVSPDIFDEDYHHSINTEFNIDVDEFQWNKENYKKFLWWTWDRSKEVTGYNYATLCRLDGNKSGWVHHFYKHSTSITSDREIDNRGLYVYNDAGERVDLDDKNYYDTTSSSRFIQNSVNKYCNSHGALFEHYGYVKELGPNVLPNSVDWTDVIAFFVCDDTTHSSGQSNGVIKFTDIPKLEKKVLEYTIDEEINYKPSSGVSWIVISGQLFYQYNGAEYEVNIGKKKREQMLSIINDDDRENIHIYCVSPVDKAITELSDSKYCSYERRYGNTYYGKGFGMWKMRLQIGDKYWYDRWNSTTRQYESGWTTTPTDFYIRYNNNPDDKADEYIPAFTWMSIANNTDYKDKVGVDGYCIKIDSNDAEAPTFGRMYLTIYTPCLLPLEVRDYFESLVGEDTVSWKEIPPVVFAKNFSLGYVYTDEDVWYKQKSNTTTPDRIYSANINDEHTNEFGGIELKVNTESKDKPISRSYVATDNGYLHSLEHVNGTPYTVDGQTTLTEKIQEYNIIDAYLDHHSERKPIYTFTVHNYYPPYYQFNYGQYLLNTNYNTDTSRPYNFIIDNQSWDLLYNKNTLKLIAF